MQYDKGKESMRVLACNKPHPVAPPPITMTSNVLALRFWTWEQQSDDEAHSQMSKAVVLVKSSDHMPILIDRAVQKRNAPWMRGMG
jgi:hypothetical protein